MKKIILFILLVIGLAIFSRGYAQTTSPEVIASSGNHFIGTNVQLSWTIGDVIIETYSNVNNQLTQGFHQTNLIVSSVKDLNSNYSVSIYPNPSSDFVNIDVPNNKELLSIEIYNVNGQSVYHESFINKTSVNLQDNNYETSTINFNGFNTFCFGKN